MKLLLILIFLFTFVYAKKDFYYGFIDSNGNQISHKLKQKIIDGYIILENVREYVKDGNINTAYTIMKAFKEKNKLKILQSEVTILYSELLLKKKSKRFILEASTLLEDAINSSTIHEEDLPKAYMLLVDLKLQTNKPEDARFFAKNIINNFNDPIIKAYGKIYLAKIYSQTREYNRAIKTLYDILAKTNDILIATVVADELFDAYIKNNDKEKAYKLINKVLEKNVDYYANDTYLAIQKVDKLLRANMPEFAIKILEELLKKTKKPYIIEEFKFKLAGIYLDMYNGDDTFLTKAKELYKDIINDFPEGDYVLKAKVFIDEILMRQGRLEPSVVGKKYKNSSSMKQKVLMQELLNEEKRGNYTQILKAKKIYKKVSMTIAKRFGYESVEVVFDDVHVLLVRQYLDEGQCVLLKKALEDVRKQTLLSLIKNKDTSQKFFDCLIEVPFDSGYQSTKKAFYNSRDANIYYNLERVAYALEYYDEAFRYSLKTDMVNDRKVLSEEFLTRFLVYNAKNDLNEMDRFFKYTLKNQVFITNNENDPKIIDFYYQYYLYLLKIDKKKEAVKVLNKLNNKQIDFKARVYSPFVELELTKLEKEKKNYVGAISILESFVKRSRKIKKDDLVHIYYELSKLYDKNENETKYAEVVQKCKSIDVSNENLYKKMCEEL